MNRAKINQAIVSTLVIGLLALTACHRHNRLHQMDAPGRHKISSHIAERLDLDQSQVKQLKTMLADLEKKRETLLNGNRLYDEFSRQLAGDEMDRSSLQRVTSEAIQKLEAYSREFIGQLADFHRTLTPAQKNKLAELLEERKDWRNRTARYQ